MMMIKVFYRIVEDWGEDVDDFYVAFKIGIGPSESDKEIEFFSFDVISPKRLEHVLVNGGVMLPRGYMITSDFNIKEIENEIDKIIKKCETEDLDDIYNNISKFLRWEEDDINY